MIINPCHAEVTWRDNESRWRRIGHRGLCREDAAYLNSLTIILCADFVVDLEGAVGLVAAEREGCYVGDAACPAGRQVARGADSARRLRQACRRQAGGGRGH